MSDQVKSHKAGWSSRGPLVADMTGQLGSLGACAAEESGGATTSPALSASALCAIVRICSFLTSAVAAEASEVVVSCVAGAVTGAVTGSLGVAPASSSSFLSVNGNTLSSAGCSVTADAGVISILGVVAGIDASFSWGVLGESCESRDCVVDAIGGRTGAFDVVVVMGSAWVAVGGESTFGDD